MVILSHHMSAEPPPLSHFTELELPKGVEQLVMSCLAKDPAERPQSALEIIERIDETGIAEEWTASRRKQWWKEDNKPEATAVVSYRDMPTFDY